MKFYVYMHTRNDTNKVFYIGKGTHDRMNWAYGRNPHWTNVAKKHGFTSHLLAEWEDEKSCFEHEKFLIACMKDIGMPLVNISNGGDGPSGRKATEEQKKKLSEIWKKKYADGYIHPKPNLGKKHSEETKRRMKEAHAKRDCSMPEEIRKKLSISSMGKKPTFGMKNKNHSEETRQKISASKKGKPWTETRRLAQKRI